MKPLTLLNYATGVITLRTPQLKKTVVGNGIIIVQEKKKEIINRKLECQFLFGMTNELPKADDTSFLC